MSHTPGPWHTGTDEDANVVYDSDCGFVAETTRDDGDSVSESDNARLISAAPELLAACKKAKKRFDELGLDWLGKGRDPLEEAIAKAEGKS